jgi:hypothetical protein
LRTLEGILADCFRAVEQRIHWHITQRLTLVSGFDRHSETFDWQRHLSEADYLNHHCYSLAHPVCTPQV